MSTSARTSPTPAFARGLPDRYQLRRHLASGGMASVWCAEDRVLGRQVAIKVLSDRYAQDGKAVRRFKREARAVARVSAHPNVVTIFDVGDLEADEPGAEQHGGAFIVMEHLAGGTVADALRCHAVTREEARRWLGEAAEALDHAHARGIVHRDIKPANFLLDRDRGLHVADFGIAHLQSEETITSAGELFGTAAYLSPEQALGKDATSASDRYALAVAAFELLTGGRPYTAQHFAAQARQHIEEAPPRASEREPSLPPAVDDVLARGHGQGARGALPDRAGVRGRAQRRPGRRAHRRDPGPGAAGGQRRAAAAVGAAAAAARSAEAASAPSAGPPGRHRRCGHGLDRRVPRGLLGPRRARHASGGEPAHARRGLEPAPDSRASPDRAGPGRPRRDPGPDPTGSGGTARPTAAVSPHARRAARTARRRRRRQAKHSASSSSSSTRTAAASAAADDAGGRPARRTTATGSGGTPSSASALQLQGHKLIAGNYPAAITILEQAIHAASPGSLPYAYALYDLGDALLRSGNAQAAIPVLEQRLQIPNQTRTVQALLDQALRAAGQARPRRARRERLSARPQAGSRARRRSRQQAAAATDARRGTRRPSA